MVSKMSNLYLENTIFKLFCRYLPHNHRQLRRLAAVCSAVMLAKSTHLSHIARWLPRPTRQASRSRFLSRFFQSTQFGDDTIYRLLLQQALQTYRTPIWHLVIDRSNWIPKEQDILMVSLSYHKRAIPITYTSHSTQWSLKTSICFRLLLSAAAWIEIPPPPCTRSAWGGLF